MSSAARILDLWRRDPVRFVRDVFRIEPDSWQADVLRAFPHNQRIAMSACKGPGKSCVMAWLVLNFLVTRPHPKIACTSITGDNLADGLWTELAKWMGRAQIFKEKFEWTKTRIVNKENYETWWVSAKAWAKGADASSQADTLAGLHADYIMFVLDEAGGIPDAVMAAAEAALSSCIEGKILIGGNPTHTSGPLWRACTSEANLWKLVRITGDPDDPNRSPRISVEWARQQIEKYGKDNPWVLVNVYGRFPPMSINALIGVDECYDAMNRVVKDSDYVNNDKRIGVDVARFGDDATVLFPRQGLMAHKPVVMRSARTDEIAARVIVAKSRWKSDREFVDDTGGFGGGVIDSMVVSGHAPVPVSFSGKAQDPRFQNKRAEMWFRMAQWIRSGGKLPNVPGLVKELTAPTYTVNSRGKLQLEDKTQIKSRIGTSPDMADALAMTFCEPENMKQTEIDQLLGIATGVGRTEVEYDPFTEVRPD